jgi:FkbM family methyltransferase
MPCVKTNRFSSQMDCSQRQHDLIYDIGAHKGDDAAFYLAKGFRVISVEAHPYHAGILEERFSSEIKEGRLILIKKGIYTHAGAIDFYAHEHDDWSSFVKTDRFTPGTYRVFPVEVIRFEDVIREFGIPYYLKVDIEGLDFAVLAHLPQLSALPRYVSFEHGDQSKEWLDVLIATGYDRFKLIEQNKKNAHPLPNPPLEGRYVNYKFTVYMTGAFGEEAMGDWLELEFLLDAMEEANRHMIPGCLASWYDIHAKHHD